MSQFFMEVQVMAQGTNDQDELTRLNQEIARLDLIKQIAEKEKAIAEARKATHDANFPKPTATPLAGETKPTGDFIESQVMAYRSVSKAASGIREGIKASGLPAGSRIIIHNANDYSLLVSYYATLQLIDDLTARYNQVIQEERKAISESQKVDGQVPKTWIPTVKGGQPAAPAFAPLAAITAATSILGSVNDLFAFFRTDEQLTGKVFTVSESPLVSAVFHALKNSGGEYKLYYPAEVPSVISLSAPSNILGKINKLLQLKMDADNLRFRIEEIIKNRNDQIDNYTRLNPQPTFLPELGRDFLQLRMVIKPLDALNLQYAAFVATLNKSEAGVVSSWLRAEGLESAMKSENSYLLKLSVIQAGGTQRIRRNLLWDVFTGGQRVSYSGGAIIEYRLYNNKGEVIRSEIIDSFTPYVKDTKLR